jgi:hypothetical protein
MDQARTDEELLINWLASRDVQCPVCQYNLRDLAAPRCPECNTELRLAVSSPSLNLGPWVVGLVSIALASGFDGVVSILVIIASFLFGPPPSPAAWHQTIAVMSGFLILTGVCTAAMVITYKSRRRWAFWSRRRQWWTAVAIFLITGLSHALIGVLLVPWL